LLNVSFSDWTQGREVASLGTNAGAEVLPFQQWRHFKEAYTPELVERAVNNSGREVARCLDPFGGSGTTALACQFLGISPVTIEVNPYLADLIEAKLSTYHSDDLAKDFGDVVAKSKNCDINLDSFFGYLPPTFIEPGVKERWIFDKSVAKRIGSYLSAINTLEDLANQRLFKALLGGILLQVSNAVVYGKGRRYRKGWQERYIDPNLVDSLFAERVSTAISDIYRYQKRSCLEYTILRGDCRSSLEQVDEFDLAVFSPPYPNSFDYTDVYNIELWVLGYLTNSDSNRMLRASTLCSHVQVARDYATPPASSPELLRVVDQLYECKADLWDRHIPAMVGGYFADMESVLQNISEKLADNGEVWMVVGDSKYAGLQVKTADILSEISAGLGLQVKLQEPFRSMRLSPQQGGSQELAESLLVVSL